MRGGALHDGRQNQFIAADDALEDIKRVRELLVAAVAIASYGSEGIEGVTSYAAVSAAVSLLSSQTLCWVDEALSALGDDSYLERDGGKIGPVVAL